MSKPVIFKMFALIVLASGCANFSQQPSSKVVSMPSTEARSVASDFSGQTNVRKIVGGTLQVTKDFVIQGNTLKVILSKGKILSSSEIYDRDYQEFACTLNLKQEFNRNVVVKASNTKYKVSKVESVRPENGLGEPVIFFEGTNLLVSIACSNYGRMSFDLEDIQETLGEYLKLELPTQNFDGKL